MPAAAGVNKCYKSNSILQNTLLQQNKPHWILNTATARLLL